MTVTRSFTKLVEHDFTWKDPKAAERAGMSMMDYVIGGMDRSFKLKLFRTLYAAETAGLQPGITSAFRDDYRQAIASGLKAASNRSYHGGSLRGGYGRGLAADIVSVNGATPGASDGFRPRPCGNGSMPTGSSSGSAGRISIAIRRMWGRSRARNTPPAAAARRSRSRM